MNAPTIIARIVYIGFVLVVFWWSKSLLAFMFLLVLPDLTIKRKHHGK